MTTSNTVQCFFCSAQQKATCCECGKPVCSEHGTHYYDEMTWCDLCLEVAEVVEANKNTTTTRNEETPHEHPIPYSPDPIHPSLPAGNQPVPDGTRYQGDTPTTDQSSQPLEKGHNDDRPVDSIEPGNTGLPGALAPSQSQVPAPVDAHPVETPPRLAVESGRVVLVHTPETPAPQSQPTAAHADHSAGSAVVDARSLPAKPPTSGRQEGTSKDKPETEPDMSGKWSNDKCVEYAEWCNERRYTVKMREEQIKKAQAIHKDDTTLTLEQFKAAYDERNDAWWQEHKGKLHVSDMKAKGSSGIDRVHEMLQRLEDKASKKRTASHLQVIPGGALPPPANAFIARSLDKDYNRQKLEQMRAEVARKQQAQRIQQIGV